LAVILAVALYIARKRRLVLRFLLRLDFCARNCRNFVALLVLDMLAPGGCGYCRRLRIGCVLLVARVRPAILGSCGYCRRLQIGCVLLVTNVRPAIIGSQRCCGRLQIGRIPLLTKALKATLPDSSAVLLWAGCFATHSRIIAYKKVLFPASARGVSDRRCPRVRTIAYKKSYFRPRAWIAHIAAAFS
jgi:hypothetical protein